MSKRIVQSIGTVGRVALSRFASSSSSSAPVKTALYDYHVEQGGKMVDFAGYLLPVVYSGDSITTSHLHTRSHCSIFDVSHMLQTKIYGSDRGEVIERLTPADVTALPADKAALTVFTDALTGGILDDLIVCNTSQGYLYIVSNAGRRDHDSALLSTTVDLMRAEKKDVAIELEEVSEVSLIAVQGPGAAAALQSAGCRAPLHQLPFMSTTVTSIGGIENCRVTRCGYTGEDGFEISVRNSAVVDLLTQLTQCNQVEVKMAGLGARDSLRLEAGLCLYGSDIDDRTTPVEAALSWLIPKSRRIRKDFPGAQIICRQLYEGAPRKRVGLRLEPGPAARHGAEVRTSSGKTAGQVTSGGPSPSLGYNIAMGYVEARYAKVGTQLQVQVRGNVCNAQVVKMPFVPSNYYSL